MAYLFLLIPVLFIAFNAYIFVKGKRALRGARPVWKISALILFCIGILSLFLPFVLHNLTHAFAEIRFMEYWGFCWMIFVFYLAPLLLLTDLLHLFNRRFKHEFLICALLIFSIMGYGYVHYLHPDVKVMNIVVNKTLNDGRKELKVVGVSDLHLGYATDVRMLRRYVELINAQHPDILLIAGDLIDNSTTPLYEQPFASVLNDLQAKEGIYMSPGNHDYYANIDRCEAFLKNTKIVFLRDSMAQLPNGLQIIGRDDRTNRQRLPLDSLMLQTDRSKPVLLLDHQPYELEHSGQLGVDFELCGHTHNGQIWPLNLLVKKLFELPYGFKRFGHAQVYVSSGLSLWGPPMRIGTDSEIAVFHLHFK